MSYIEQITAQNGRWAATDLLSRKPSKLDETEMRDTAGLFVCLFVCLVGFMAYQPLKVI